MHHYQFMIYYHYEVSVSNDLCMSCIMKEMYMYVILHLSMYIRNTYKTANLTLHLNSRYDAINQLNYHIHLCTMKNIGLDTNIVLGFASFYISLSIIPSCLVLGKIKFKVHFTNHNMNKYCPCVKGVKFWPNHMLKTSFHMRKPHNFDS